MDLCLRARRAGYEVVVVPRSRVLHVGQASTGAASLLTTFYSVRNHMLVASRYGRLATPLLKTLVFIYHALHVARSRPPRMIGHFGVLLRGATAACAGHLGSRQAM